MGFKILEDGTKFKGIFHEGQEKGHGIKTLSNGTVFEGVWDGSKIVRGKVNYIDGEIYQGNF